MIKVLCFVCGHEFTVPYGTREISKQCPNCKDQKSEHLVYLTHSESLDS